MLRLLRKLFRVSPHHGPVPYFNPKYWTPRYWQRRPRSVGSYWCHRYWP